MRTLRVCLVGTAILALLGGLTQVALAQSDDERSGAFTLKVVREFEELEFEPTWVSREGFADIDGGGIVFLVEASDPRLSGTWTRVKNIRATPQFNMSVGSVRVENEGGTWLGRFEGIGVERLPIGDEHQLFFVGWTVLEGQGGYEGLTAIVVSDEAKMAEMPDVDGMGLVVDFGRPPQPELPGES